MKTAAATETQPRTTGFRITWRHWTGLSILALAAGTLIIWNWVRMTEHERVALVERVAADEGLSRAALEEAWMGPEAETLVEWTPGRDAALALAVRPRTPRMKWDAIYTLYDGDRPRATFVLTPIGGWFNGARIDARKHPDTMTDRPLTADEGAALEQMIAVLDARQAEFHAVSSEYSWTQHVARTARDLLALNRGATPAGQTG